MSTSESRFSTSAEGLSPQDNALVFSIVYHPHTRHLMGYIVSGEDPRISDVDLGHEVRRHAQETYDAPDHVIDSAIYMGAKMATRTLQLNRGEPTFAERGIVEIIQDATLGDILTRHGRG